MTEIKLYQEAVELLKLLITTPSYSKEEDITADLIERFFHDRKIQTNRLLNNVWCVNRYYDNTKPSILLNSHHDTVKPDPNYTRNPFAPVIEDGKLYGLGSNDAGGCLVSLMAAFMHFYDRQDLKYNLILAATAEEEISGSNGIERLLSLENENSPFENKKMGFAIVGEPTGTNLAIAEKGLLVLDCICSGKAGHAAREEGVNAIYQAMKDIEWFAHFKFPKISEMLGEIKMSVTSIHTANKAHNMVPSECNFVVDVRVTDSYTHEEVLETIGKHVHCRIKARSFRLRSSSIDKFHPVVQAGIKLGKKTYGSPTTSDGALMNLPVLKCGPGDSARSHTADEYIYLKEIEEGIETYIKLVEAVI